MKNKRNLWGGKCLRVSLLVLAVTVLSQCNSLRSDCEAILVREQEIAQEQPGDYYIGRRYYVPTTRFWGYLRRPGQDWRTAKLVVMDEAKIPTPDRGLEPPSPQSKTGFDQNWEYVIQGDYTGEMVYEPNSNQVLPAFKALSYQARSQQPGFLFVPSEKYRDNQVTLYPALIPSPELCRQTLKKN